MTEQELLQRFSEILSPLLGADSLVLTMETTREDVPDWDSFNYVNFIVALEMEFDIRFSVSDVESFHTVGDIVKETQTLIEDAV